MTTDASSITFAAYFSKGNRWFLHSWGIEKESVGKVIDEILSENLGEGVKAEPTPESLATFGK